MSFLFDARWLGAHGIGRFANEISVAFDVEPLAISGNPVAPWDGLKLSRVLANYQVPQWFFSPGISAPLVCPVPYILTIHDLNHVDRPDNSSVAKRLYYRTVLTWQVKQAKAIFTVSEYTKQRIAEYFSIPSTKIFNVGNCIAKCFYVEQAPAVLEGEYFLCVSNRKGHKNEANTLAAFAQALIAPSVRLVFTGQPTQALLKKIQGLGLIDRVVFTGELSDTQLVGLYRGALGVLFVSLYEGFGMPIIEAFISNTPVITSTSTAMPEIAKDGALLVDPHRPLEIAQAIQRLYTDKALCATLIARGQQLASCYTHQRLVDNIANALTELQLPFTKNLG